MNRLGGAIRFIAVVGIIFKLNKKLEEKGVTFATVGSQKGKTQVFD